MVTRVTRVTAYMEPKRMACSDTLGPVLSPFLHSYATVAVVTVVTLLPVISIKGPRRREKKDLLNHLCHGFLPFSFGQNSG